MSRPTHNALVNFPSQAIHQKTASEPAYSMASVLHGLGMGLFIGLPAGLLWGCFFEPFWITGHPSASLSLISYYAFWALLGGSLGVGIIGTRCLKPAQSETIEPAMLWSQADRERAPREEREYWAA